MSLNEKQIQQISAYKKGNEICFTDERETTDSSLCVLNTKGFISIQGSDAAKFMQGQLSCDIEEITQHHSLLGAHCTPKGRAIANFRLACIAEDNYLFSLPEDNCHNLLDSLNKYIVFSKAKLAIVSDEYIAIGLSGKQAKAFIERHLSPFEPQANSIVSSHGIAVCIKENEYYELWLNQTQLVQLWPELKSNFTTLSTDEWHKAHINMGLVEITAALSEELIPQMFNLDKLGGISFTKGCYTGQEIIARLKYLGKQKRSLAKFTNLPTHTAVGSELFNKEGKSQGIVVAISKSEDAYIGLAVISDKIKEDKIAFISHEQLDLHELSNA